MDYPYTVFQIGQHQIIIMQFISDTFHFVFIFGFLLFYLFFAKIHFYLFHLKGLIMFFHSLIHGLNLQSLLILCVFETFEILYILIELIALSSNFGKLKLLILQLLTNLFYQIFWTKIIIFHFLKYKF